MSWHFRRERVRCMILTMNIALTAALAIVTSVGPGAALVAQQADSELSTGIEWLHTVDGVLPKSGSDSRPTILYFTFDT